MQPPSNAPRTPYDDTELLQRARRVKERAYAPYSGFRVGAAVRTETGAVFDGVNVENASLGLTLCAERVAIATMVASGGPAVIEAIAVVGDGRDPCTPCGACRQVIVEFGPHAAVLASGDGGRPLLTTIGALLPHKFTTSRLAQGRRQESG